MEPGAPTRYPRLAAALLGAALQASGCLHTQPQLVQALHTEADPAAAGRAYPVACPDLLLVELRDRPAWGGAYPVEPDGRVTLGPAGRVRVEGLTVGQAARQIAEAVGHEPDGVRVEVLEYNSRRLFLFGGGGAQRAVDYRGPETVVALLRRADALKPAAKLSEVHVVRGHVADGRPPEVFPVDLEAIAFGGDPSSNLVLEPFDQVYVGETRRASLCRMVPAWMRPAYQAACGLAPPGAVLAAMTPNRAVARAAGE
jgi:polysaccharide export outer membrane protein